MPKRRKPAEPYLDYLLAAASERVGRQLALRLEESGVPLECWRILNLLRTGEGLTMGELAEAGLLSLPTATRTIDRMVRDTLVYRAPHPEDRRKVVIFISDKGLRVWAQLKESVDRCQDDIVEQFGEAWMRELLGKLGALAGKGEAQGKSKR